SVLCIVSHTSLHIYSLSFYNSPDHRNLHSFPTRRSSDLEDGVNIAQLAAQIECSLDCVSRNASGYVAVLINQFPKHESFPPRAHGVRLHQAISVFARNALLHKIKKQLPAKDQAAGAFQVCL